MRSGGTPHVNGRVRISPRRPHPEKLTNRILDGAFFDRSPEIVARELLGKYLVRRNGQKIVAMPITETEAYGGEDDRASHARHGKTARNAPMFAAPGTLYVYFTYGMHWMANIVCGKEGIPSAVLIRGAGDVSGPARLTKFFAVGKALNGKPLGVETGLWVEDRGDAPENIRRTPRVGVDYAGAWAKKPWRFVCEAGHTRENDLAIRKRQRHGD